MSHSLIIPNDLEERFTPPANWRHESFTNPETGHNIHYRTANVDEPHGTIICLPGLSEFGEKYIEEARFFNQQGFNFVVIDWAYQGLSTRFNENIHKRHSDGYETDLSDLNMMIEQIKSSTPLLMLGHSMGGHIGLRYMAENPYVFKSASLSAPMLGINILKAWTGLASTIVGNLKYIHESYLPSGKDWQENKRTDPKLNFFTNDPIRGKIHNAWCIANPQLKIGDPTYGWLNESLKSITKLITPETLSRIIVPVFIGYADQEKIVDNDAILKALPLIPNAEGLLLNNAKHEIMKEKNIVRNEFLDRTLRVFNL